MIDYRDILHPNRDTRNEAPMQDPTCPGSLAASPHTPSRSALQSYIGDLLELLDHEDADLEDNLLREQMVSGWYALTPEERKLMDRLVERLKLLAD